MANGDLDRYKKSQLEIQVHKQTNAMTSLVKECRDNREEIAKVKVSHEALQVAVERISYLMYGIAGTVIAGMIVFYITNRSA